MSSTGTAVLATVMTGLVTAAAVGPVLRALPEPAGATYKISYRSLLTPGFHCCCAEAGGSGGCHHWYRVPLAAQPLWTVLSTAGVLLAAIDAGPRGCRCGSRRLPGC